MPLLLLMSRESVANSDGVTESADRMAFHTHAVLLLLHTPSAPMRTACRAAPISSAGPPCKRSQCQAAIHPAQCCVWHGLNLQRYSCTVQRVERHKQAQPLINPSTITGDMMQNLECHRIAGVRSCSCCRAALCLGRTISKSTCVIFGRAVLAGAAAASAAASLSCAVASGVAPAAAMVLLRQARCVLAGLERLCEVLAQSGYSCVEWLDALQLLVAI